MVEYRYDIEKKKRRLSQDGKGEYVGHDKKLYSIHHGVETYEYIHHDDWEREVVRNPTGLTATKARKTKDPDLNKIEVPVIGINHNAKVPNSIPSGTRGVKAEENHREVKSKIYNDREYGKVKGYTPFEGAKGVKRHKIKMVDED